MRVSRRRPLIVVVGALLMLITVSGCTLAGANPAPLTPVSPGEVPEFEPLEPEAEVEEPETILTPTQVAPVDVFGTQTATAPTGEEEPGAAATPLGEDTGEPAETAEPVETPAAPATQAPAAGECPTTYVVQSGDTLFSIAQRYGVTTGQITAANNIANPDRLALGQELTIPCPDGTTAGGETTTGGETVYVVQPGDNLFRIARRYGLTTEELAAYNNISDPTRLSVGQEIRIPPD